MRRYDHSIKITFRDVVLFLILVLSVVLVGAGSTVIFFLIALA